MLKIEFRAMGCGMAAFLDSETQAAVDALGLVPGWFEEWEQSLSRFRPDSELNQLNASAGNTFQTSPILWEATCAALEAAEWTGGLVVPTVLHALEQAGYDRSFELLQSGQYMVPSQDPWSEYEPIKEDWRDIRMDAGRKSIFLPSGMKLDLSGTAKGWAAQQAMRRLEVIGPALVNAGGDIACSGPLAIGRAWPVDVADPLKAQENLGLLALERCGVATSGIDYRRWLRDGAWKHHIIDPRTGHPAQTDLMSVTVVAPDVLLAEAAAKTVMILGSLAGFAWLEGQPSLAGILAMDDGRLLHSQNMKGFLWR